MSHRGVKPSPSSASVQGRGGDASTDSSTPPPASACVGRLISIEHDAAGTPVRVEVSAPTVNEGRPFMAHFVEAIGKGSFGTVYRATSDAWEGWLAVKLTSARPARLEEEIRALYAVQRRAPVHLRGLVVRFEFGAISGDGKFAVVGTELCLPLTLHDFLLKNRVPFFPQMLRVVHQVICAVAAVHEAGCIHRDIKLQNFVFTAQGDLRLIDFGLAATTPDPPAGDTVAGTVSFMAPEMAHNALHPEARVPVGLSSDTWSLGITLFSILTRRTPYPTTTTTTSAADNGEKSPAATPAAADDPKAVTLALLRRVAKGEWSWPVEHDKEPSHAPLYQLVERMLIVKPEDRPTVTSLLTSYTGLLAKRTTVVPPCIKAFIDLYAPPQPPAPPSRGGTPAAKKPMVGGTAKAGSVAPSSSQPSKAAQTVSSSSTPSTPTAAAAPAKALPTSAAASQRRPGAVALRDTKSESVRRGNSTPAPSTRANALVAAAAAAAKSAADAGPAPVTSVRAAPPLPLAVVPASTKGRPGPTLSNASPKDVIAAEKRDRHAMQALLLLQLKQVQSYVRDLEEAQDQERYNITWLAELGLKYATHPHKLQALTSWPAKGYENGFACDQCCYDFAPPPPPPTAGRKSAAAGKGAAAAPPVVLFFHCACGMDLCPPCAEAYFAKRTCTACTKSFATLTAKQQHRCTVQVLNRAAPQLVQEAPPAKSKRARPSTSRSVPAVKGRSQPPAEPPRVVADSFLKTDVAFPNAFATNPTPRVATPLRPVLDRLSGGGGVAADGFHEDDDMMDDELHPTRGVSPPLSSTWNHYESDTWRQGRPSGGGGGGGDPSASARPTAEELEWLTDGDWIKSVRHINAHSSLPDGFAYRIQPGRTGFIFGTNDFPAHSAVLAGLEQQMLVIHRINRNRDDAATLYDLDGDEADVALRFYRNVIHRIAVEDATNIKMNRSPGLASVFAPAHRPVMCDRDEAFVYVRHVRVAVEAQLTLVMLSNGRFQVLAGSYDLRWRNRARVFMMRSNGECEAINLDTFMHSDALHELIMEDLRMSGSISPY